jgi:hypothetical protein
MQILAVFLVRLSSSGVGRRAAFGRGPVPGCRNAAADGWRVLLHLLFLPVAVPELSNRANQWPVATASSLAASACGRLELSSGRAGQDLWLKLGRGPFLNHILVISNTDVRYCGMRSLP